MAKLSRLDPCSRIAVYVERTHGLLLEVQQPSNTKRLDLLASLNPHLNAPPSAAKMLNETIFGRQVADVREHGLFGRPFWLNALYAFLLYSAFLVGFHIRFLRRISTRNWVLIPLSLSISLSLSLSLVQ